MSETFIEMRLHGYDKRDNFSSVEELVGAFVHEGHFSRIVALNVGSIYVNPNLELWSRGGEAVDAASQEETAFVVSLENDRSFYIDFGLSVFADQRPVEGWVSVAP